MTYSDTKSTLRRRLLGGFVAATATFALAACSGGDTTSSASSPAGGGAYEVETDHGIGSVDAPVTIVEYASVVCPACANWNNTVYPDLKEKYVDTGKVRYVFRPFPTNPIQLADAGHMIALCSGDDKFLTSIKYQFERQQQIMNLARDGKAREAYLNIAKLSGLSEDEFEACLVNEELQAEYEAVVQSGVDLGVTGTPGFIVNGEYTRKTPSGKAFYTLESIEEVILPLLGEPVPAPSDDDNSDTDSAQ